MWLFWKRTPGSAAAADRIVFRNVLGGGGRPYCVLGRTDGRNTELSSKTEGIGDSPRVLEKEKRSDAALGFIDASRSD